MFKNILNFGFAVKECIILNFYLLFFLLFVGVLSLHYCLYIKVCLKNNMFIKCIKVSILNLKVLL